MRIVKKKYDTADTSSGWYAVVEPENRIDEEVLAMLVKTSLLLVDSRDEKSRWHIVSSPSKKGIFEALWSLQDSFDPEKHTWKGDINRIRKQIKCKLFCGFGFEEDFDADSEDLIRKCNYPFIYYAIPENGWFTDSVFGSYPPLRVGDDTLIKRVEMKGEYYYPSGNGDKVKRFIIPNGELYYEPDRGERFLVDGKVVLAVSNEDYQLDKGFLEILIDAIENDAGQEVSCSDKVPINRRIKLGWAQRIIVVE